MRPEFATVICMHPKEHKRNIALQSLLHRTVRNSMIFSLLMKKIFFVDDILVLHSFSI